uniref:Uncharacterized protein n=1 Tax=Nelumbo nucifera TaxID=4432 RepID=A0A822XQE3_NELNU|nr:TPA_asm: hypothetical protein HUJ06_022834 [Nelumbo nucifera]
MTSASELFYVRRSRAGRNTTELGLFSATDRNLHQNRRHTYQRSDDCDPLRRSSHVRHLCSPGFHTGREASRINHGGSQSGTGNSTGTETSSRRTDRLRFSSGNRLPGAVIQARERLLERLRGKAGVDQHQAFLGMNLHPAMTGILKFQGNGYQAVPHLVDQLLKWTHCHPRKA